MNAIKQLREESGYTQTELAAAASLSLRTIQRLEQSAQAPKGNSLKVLASVFDLEPIELQRRFLPPITTQESEKTTVSLINLSTLIFFVLPFGNILFPLLLWRRNRTSKIVDEMGRSIINFQILWSLTLIFSLILAPFVQALVATSIPLILCALFICLAGNLVVVFLTARAIRQGRMDFLRLPVALL